MVFGSWQMHSRLVTPSLTFRELVPEQTSKDLGVILDTNLTYDEHITKAISSCMSCLIQISRTLLTTMNAPASSKLFYCSNVRANTSKSNTSKLQSIQNFAARIATSTRKYEHITPVLKDQSLNGYQQQLSYTLGTLSPGGIPPYKSDGGARRKNSRTPVKGTRIMFYERAPNSFSPARGNNSTTKNYITGTVNFNSNKDNF